MQMSSHQVNCWVGEFDAMASPCEVLMAVDDRAQAEELLKLASKEAWRIEQKFSRYRQDGIIPRINNNNGKPVIVDDETAQLINFAYQCYGLSDGLFDVTSGILRKAWSFKPDSELPEQHLIKSLLPFIGLEKARWDAPEFALPSGMQIDFGGIGKEYAVDRTLKLLLAIVDAPMLVNFGGDIVCNRAFSEEKPWLVGIESPADQCEAAEFLEVRTGALATSGSTQRYLVDRGKRYGHVLNPTTGWPIEQSPLSVTVAATSCTQAGMLATFAMLKGKDAEAFLEQQGVRFWVIR
ncbi:MAG TPA: FAD:protein FMN transferase [Gammaproteobacteria bacterium]|nr:FAD:protein FMN transferase [Gammaproteobacteria bacterium]